MNRRNTWLLCLGLSGAGLLFAGCGGSNVPDPESDSRAATDGAPGAGGAPAGPAPAAAAPAVAEGGEAAKAEEAQPAQPKADAPAKGQGGGTTNEMLAMATTPGAPAPPGGAPPPAGGAPGPGGAPAPATPGGGAPMPGGGMGPGAPGGGGPRMGPGSPGMKTGPSPSDMAGMMKSQQENMQKQMAGRQQGGGVGAMANMAGGAGGPGGPGATKDDGPGDFSSPIGAVQAFLSALKAKDADRLSEATALRASSAREGTSIKSQDLAKKIQDLSLTDPEMDELAKKLEGYTIAGENPARSTGRADVIIRKSGENGAYTLRKVTVRKEKKGWGVLDIAGPQVFKPQGGMGRPGATRGKQR